jgi:hypothetical protein
MGFFIFGQGGFDLNPSVRQIVRTDDLERAATQAKRGQGTWMYRSQSHPLRQIYSKVQQEQQ